MQPKDKTRAIAILALLKSVIEDTRIVLPNNKEVLKQLDKIERYLLECEKSVRFKPSRGATRDIITISNKLFLARNDIMGDKNRLSR